MPRPEPAPGARNYVLLILDSCRFDAFVAAKPPCMSRLGPLERRFSYASWTSPAHFNLLMGLLPHPSPQHIFASAYYKKSLLRFQDRLGFEGLSFSGMIPRLWLPDYLRNTAGYFTRALVSMPVLNPRTPIAADFDSYVLVDRHNDLSAMVDQMVFSAARPTFYLLNTGETHYPYAPPDEPPSQWPRIHGVHGIFRQVSAGQPIHAQQSPRFFNADRLAELRQRQIDVLAHVDRAVEKLFDHLPRDTYVTITSDHGELFGEDGYFGHGPINHPKVLEVPLIEGRLR
ncbi:MAG: sulfatase-like hydrolase/transferase [Myxococcota bacterium]